MPLSKDDPREKITIEHKHSPALDDLDAKIVISGKKMTLREFRKIEKKYKDSYERSKEDAIVFWDDICQLTSLGLISYIEKIEEISIEYNIDDYFRRTESDIVKYVHSLLVENKIDKTIEYVADVFKENYAKILEMSPVTNTFTSIMRCTPVYISLTFIFSHDWDGRNTLVKSIKEEFGIESDIINSLVVGDKDIEDFIKDDLPINWSTAFASSVVPLVEFIYTKERLGTNLFAPEHRGYLDNEVHALSRKFTGSANNLLYGTTVTYYEEGLAYVPD